VGWNEGVSFPIQSGHGCIGCSEENFWDNGPFYERLANVNTPLGVEANVDRLGLGAVAITATAVAAHTAASALQRARSLSDKDRSAAKAE
jgi:hydrogenase small subunit